MQKKVIEQLIDVPLVSSHASNPRSGQIAFTWNISGGPALYTLGPRDGAPQRLVEGSGQHPSWSPAGHHLLFLRDAAGGEADDLWVLDIKSGGLRALTDDQFGYSWPRLSTAGQLAVLSDRGGNIDPYLIDLENGRLTRLATGEGPASSLEWSPDGDSLGYLRLMGDAEMPTSAVCLWERCTGRERVIARLEGDLFQSSWSWRPTDSTELTIPADHGDHVALCQLRTDGTQVWVAPVEGDLWQPLWSPPGEWLAFIQEHQAQRRLVLWHGTTHEVRVVGVGEGLHRQMDWMPGGDALTVLFESATQPPSLWRVPVDGKAATPLLPDATATLPTETLTPSRFVRYESFDGLSIPALLYEPHEPNGDAVMWVHGGPAGQHPDGWFPELQLLAAAGYTVLAPNMRGSSGFGRRFRDMSRFDWGGGELQDLAYAHRWLMRSGTRRVVVLGQSLGGYLGLMALTQQPALWAAGVLYFPIADLERLYADTRPDLRHYLVNHIGRPEERRAWFRERSPIHALDQIEAPLLLLHGENDPRVPLAESMRVTEVLNERGHPCDLRHYANEGHGFRERESRLDAAEQVLAFLAAHLGE